MLQLLLLLLTHFRLGSGGSPVPEGFPARWDGDRYYHTPCDVIQKPPSWLDGYFFCQLCASYGDQSTPAAHHVEHMFDAIGGLAVFRVSPENTTFSGAYYPTRSYKIWNFYDRDFAESSLAWRPVYAKGNESANQIWKHILPEWDPWTPNVDFWKVNDKMIAGTELYSVGFTFNHETVDNFHFFPFKEATPAMQGQPMHPLQMPIHERMDPETGLLWATTSALDTSNKPPSLHQVVFSVDEDGVRRVEGIFDFSPWDPSLCSSGGGWYKYDPHKDLFPRNIHSITSTKHYLIIPLNSIVFNPCLLLKGPNAGDVSFEEAYRFDKDTPISFLIFDKRSKTFINPIKFDQKNPMFASHQFNAYEITDKTLVADMIMHSADAYNFLTVPHLTKSTVGLSMTRTWRFSMDLDKGIATSKPLLPNDPPNLEFPQFNHNFEGLPYKYGYAINNVFFTGNSILKIDMDDPSGKKNKIFTPKANSMALLEPYFVQRPGSTEEDDGVLVARAFDTDINKGKVYVIDAKNMEKVGEMVAPIGIPFGFHERFYLKEAFNGKKKGKMGKSEL